MPTLLPSLPETPAAVRDLMARIGPIWAKDIRAHIAATTEAFSALQKQAPKDGVRVERDVVLGPHERQRIDVYRPEGGAAKRAAVIFVHGGGFTEGQRNVTDEIYGNVLYYFARHGMVGINAGYRLAPEARYPEASRDIGAVVAWARDNAEALGIDPARVFLIGHSAGGTHVATYTLDKSLHPSGGSGVAGLIVISGRVRADNHPHNPNAKKVEAYYGTDASVFDKVAAVMHVDEHAPPTFIAMAEFENPLIDVYCLELAHKIAVVRGRAPPVLWMPGHNHISIVAHMNTAEDVLGTALRRFIDDVIADTSARRT